MTPPAPNEEMRRLLTRLSAGQDQERAEARDWLAGSDASLVCQFWSLMQEQPLAIRQRITDQELAIMSRLASLALADVFIACYGGPPP